MKYELKMKNYKYIINETLLVDWWNGRDVSGLWFSVCRKRIASVLHSVHILKEGADYVYFFFLGAPEIISALSVE